MSVRGVESERRATLVIEHSVLVGRIGTVLGLAAVLLTTVAIFAGVTGALFVSPEVGIQWFVSTIELSRQAALSLTARPALAVSLLGLGYLIHLAEYHQHIDGLDIDVGRTRPRWHYLTVFAVSGLIGGGVWILSQLYVLGPVFLAAGMLTWSASTIALVYFLHYTVLEDRWSYGLRIRAALWKFPAQYATGLVLYDGVMGLPGPASIGYAVVIVPPLVGLLYPCRRYLAFTERWARVSRRVQQVTRPVRQVLPKPSWSILERHGTSPVTNQFGEMDEPSRDEAERKGDTKGACDRDQELRQTREWASYLESELHDREDQVQELEARLARLGQELRDARQDDSEAVETATRERDTLLTDLFDIRDNFRRALDAETALEDDAASDLRASLELVDRQIRSILEGEGVEEVDTSGKVDPRKHRVVKTVPTTAYEPNEIVDVYRLGYRLDDRVLREAHVVVAEDPAADEGGDATDDDSQVNRGGEVS
jgi:molecular chaperone GrpE